MKPVRITAVRNGQRVPMFDSEPEGMRSPSPTLLIETHGAHGDAPTSRALTDQVATLFLGDALVEHRADGGPPAAIAVPACAVVLSLRDRIETIRWAKPARVMSVRLDDRVLDEAALTFGLRMRSDLQPDSGARDAQLTMLMQALHLEQRNAFRTGRLYLDGIEQALAATLVSRYAAGALRSSASMNGLGPARAKRVDAFVRAHLSRTITLDELAGCAGYSASHFSFLFAQTFGTTPHRYLQRARIERATTLLMRPHWSVLDVAIECGFQTQQHFSRVFRAILGVSPTEFRRGR